MELHDLVLALEGSGSTYRAQLRWNEIEAGSEFRLPRSAVALQGVLAQLARSSGDSWEAARSLGSDLFEAVFGGDLGNLLENALGQARSEEREQRLWLEPREEARELFGVPWELLCDSRQLPEKEFLALSGVSVIRGWLSSMPPSHQSEAPLRLLVGIASPSELAAIDIEGEKALFDQLEQHQEALERRAVVNVSLDSLRRAVEEYKPDVVHLVGHGRQREGQAEIAFEDDDRGVLWVSEADLGELGRHSRGNLRLMLIMADTATPQAGVSGHLGPALLAGVPAALSMQFPLTTRTAHRFTESFYKAFLGGRPVDAAVVRAREELSRWDPGEKRSRGDRVDALTWASPVLYARSGADLRPPAPRLRPRSAVPQAPPWATATVATEPEQEPAEAAVAPERDKEPITTAAAPEQDAELITPVAASEPEEASFEAATPRIEIGTLGGAVDDTVGSEDQLGFQHYVDAFADLITSPHARPPLTIGIFGSWGMGKSFLLEHIEREISRRQNEEDKGTRKRVGPRVHVVRFNAWEYSATEIVWPGLVRKIVKKLDEDVPWPWYKRRWTRLKWNLPRELRRLWAPLLAVALVAAVAIAVAIWRDHANLAAAIIAAAGALGVGGLVKAASNPIARWVTALFAESDYGRQIGYMEDIKHDLETLEGRLHEGGNVDAPVVGRILVLIDDLDRCEPEKAVEVLQAVNLLLNFKSFVVCLGIDARVVTGAVEKHYEGLLGKAGASGYEYLDKIVQIPFRIPEPSEDEVRTFITKQLPLGLSLDDVEDAPSKEQEAATTTLAPGHVSMANDVVDTASIADTVTMGDTLEAAPQEGTTEIPYRPSETPADDDEALDARMASGEAPPEEAEAGVPFTRTELNAFEQLVPFLRPNPRHLKRLVNVYRLVRALARSKEEDLILDNPAATIRWLVMWGQWPYTSHAMLARFELLLDEWEGKIANNAPEGDPLLNLLEAVEPRLDLEIRGRLDDAADMLRDLLAVEGCSLAWDEIRRIQRYTLNFNPAVEEQLSRSVTSGQRAEEIQEDTSTAARPR